MFLILTVSNQHSDKEADLKDDSNNSFPENYSES